MTSSCVSGRAQGLSGWCLGALALLVAVLGLSGPASAGTPGQIDPGFEAPAVNERIFSAAVQPDGKILIGGTFTLVDGQPRTSVARLNVDGSVDGTFSPPTLFRQVQALAVQPDGKVLIGGNVFPFDSPRQALIRLNADGSIDEGFVDPGLWRPDSPNTGTVESIALQPDGKILIGGNFTKLGGESGEPRERVARLNADGTIDFGFGSPEPNSGPNGAVNSLALQPDGKVLIGGTFTSLGGVPRERAARLGDSGTLDELFVDPLIANETGAGGTPIVESILPQPNGKVLIGGSFTRVGGQADPENVRGGAARLEADGTLDEDFAPPFFGGVVNSVVLQRDGEIPLGGTFSDPGPERGKHLARLKANGTLDTSFTSPFSATFTAVDSLALQPDGKLVFSIVDSNSSPTVYEVIRVLNTSPQAAPTSVSATAGNGQVTVSWTAVAGEITEYTATASSGGHSCNTTSETSCTVTGLNNGIPYTFTVKAANEFGDGPTSAASDEVTPEAPKPPSPGKAALARPIVKGPAKVSRGRKATYRVTVKNTGNAAANKVMIKAQGRGAKASKAAGSLAAGSSKTVPLRLKLRKRGKVKITFTVTSSNAGSKSAPRTVRVR